MNYKEEKYNEVNFKLMEAAIMEEEKYTVEEILDALEHGRDLIIAALKNRDRDMLEDVIKDFI